MATIPDFFAGQNIFLTGISGFLGKVIVEKLLRSCPKIEAIYVLIREKKGANGEDRLKAILAEKLFDSLHRLNPECFTKVKLISGDLLKDQMILHENDLSMLQEKISIVIHSAASVRFTESLRSSVETNLRATYKLLQFGKTLKNLISFVYVSTAYSNCQLLDIEEKIYKSEDPMHVMSICEWMTEDLLEHLCPKLLKDRPNTYTFTKALAENLVEQYSSQIPIAIVRPSIITGAAFEPLPGWVDNYNGPNGLLIALATGFLTTLYTELDLVADLIPVDYVANTILAAAKHTNDGFKIYNCTSGTQNPVKWRTLMEQVADFPLRYPTKSLVRYPHNRITSHRPLHQVRFFLQHYVPARIIDAVLKCAGKKPVLSRLYERLSNSMGVSEFGTTNEWAFHNTNTQKLFEGLHPSDKDEFNFDVLTIDWAPYLQSYCFGIRQYVLKEDLSSLDEAKSHLRRLKYINYATSILLALCTWKACCNVLPCADLNGLC